MRSVNGTVIWICEKRHVKNNSYIHVLRSRVKYFDLMNKWWNICFKYVTRNRWKTFFLINLYFVIKFKFFRFPSKWHQKTLSTKSVHTIKCEQTCTLLAGVYFQCSKNENNAVIFLEYNQKYMPKIWRQLQSQFWWRQRYTDSHANI